MGLKSGSRDAGLDESKEEEDEKDIDDSPDDERNLMEPETEHEQNQTFDSETSNSPTPDTGSDDERPTVSSLPYKICRDKVNEGREQVPYFLRKEVIEAEDGLQDTLEDLVGEDVYKSDYREASMVVAQRNPKLVAEVLREWGYDLESA